MVNKSITTFEKGLVRVKNKTKQPKNSYSYALNTVPNDEITDRSSRINERGFDEYIQLKEEPYHIIGHQWLGDEQYVFFIKDIEGAETPFNEIWYVDIKEEIQELKYSNLGLNLKEAYPITSTYRTDYRNHRIIYWVDGLNDDRVIDIDNPDVLTLDLSMISMNSSEIKPNISVESDDNGGAVKSGQYFIAVAYKDETNYVTGASNFTKPISISTSNYESVSSSILTNGSELDVVTSKKLVIDVDNIDTRYSYLIIYIIQVTDTDTKIYTTDDIRINGTSIEYEFTGLNVQQDTTITINDLVVPRINYFASNIINQKENRLIRGNLKIKETLIDYQQIANNITVNYDVEEKLVNTNLTLGRKFEYGTEFSGSESTNSRESRSYRNYSISSKYLSETGNSLNITSKTFMRDEVYALGISFELNDGTETDVFHIPGRALNSFTDTSAGEGEYARVFTNQANWDNDMVDSNPRWLEMNTAIKRTGDLGELGYWRSNEVYPDGYGYPTDGEQDGSGKSYVRHHKIPSDVLEPLYRTETIETTDDNIRYEVYTRYIKLNINNINIPAEYQGIITKINLHYVKRDDSNKSIISKGLLYGVGFFDSQLRQSYQFNIFNTGGAAYQFVSPDVDFRFKQFPISANRFKSGYIAKGYVAYFGRSGVSPTLYYRPELINNYIFNLNDGNPPHTTLLVGSTMYVQNTIPIESNYQIDINEILFTDTNAVGSINVGGLNLNYNFAGESNSTILTRTSASTPIIITAADYPELDYEDTSAINLIQGFNYNDDQEPPYGVLPSDEILYDSVTYGSLIRDNRTQYGNPNNLIYIHSGASVITNNIQIYNDIEIKNGDCFIDVHYSKKGYSVNNTDPLYNAYYLPDDGQTGESLTGIGAITSNSYIAFIVETDLNIRLRNEDTNIPEAGFNYWPISPIDVSDKRYSFEKKATGPEYYNIYPSYNNTNIKEYYANDKLIVDFTNTGINKYENRLVYSDKQSYEDEIDSFRITRANNYKDLPMDRGQITQSFIKDDKFFVLTRDALYNVYASNKTIQSLDNDNIVVGTGEFFGLEPVELMSIKGGFGGTSSKYSLSESPYGYLFVDRLKSKAILFNESLKDINVGGLNEDYTLEMYNQFKELELEDKFDNPIVGPGIISIYDPRLHRLLITKKDYIGLEDVVDNYQGLFDPDLEYSIGDIVAKDGVLVEITDRVETYIPKWIGVNGACILDEGFNNGYWGYTNLVKVSNDVNEYPLDINDVRTSVSGLPQDSKPNSILDSDYIPPVEDLITCPITVQVDIINTDTDVEDPYRLFVDTNLDIYVNDVLTYQLYSTSADVIYFDRGDIIKINQTSGYTAGPWPPNSVGNLTVITNGTEVYNNDQTNQTATIIDGMFSLLNTYTFTAIGGNCDIISTGTSTAVGYRKYTFEVDILGALDPNTVTLSFNITDDTTSTSAGQKNSSEVVSEFNVVDDSNTIDIQVINTNLTESYTVILTGDSSGSQVVGPSSNYTFTNLVKSNYLVEIS